MMSVRNYGYILMLGACFIGANVALAQDATTDTAVLQTQADAGDTRAMSELGKAYLYGNGVEADPALALSYFEQADAAGDRKAARYLGLIAAQNGDLAKAAQWYAKGAQNGDITSQYYLGLAYQTGSRVAQDFDLAMQWFETAAERGDIIASDGMVGMASLYEAGQGVAIDMDRATTLYRQAADLGNEAAIAALMRLGVE